MGTRLSRLFGRAGKVHTPEAGAYRSRQTIGEESDVLASDLNQFRDKSNEDVFLQRLKGVYVESSTETTKVTNPFGVERKQLDDVSPWKQDSSKGRGIPAGYISVQHVVELFDKVKNNKDYSVGDIVKDFQLAEDDAANLIKYFNNFKVIANVKIEAKV